ncbi:MAG TPA: ADP-ribosylglycohydrolase family protein, partial [Rhodothermales bacterium]|nr:ADP-ribosylglycohydrolase family protein [Rhodothermales bacterium]
MTSAPLLGAAIGDALAMPIAGLSHQNVRLFYRGIKGYTADEKRGGAAGTGTEITARLLALASAVPRAAFDEIRAPADETAGAAATAAALARCDDNEASVWLARLTPRGPARAAAHVQHRTLQRLSHTSPETFDTDAFWETLRWDTHAAEGAFGSDGRLAARLDALTGHLHLFPLDLQDLCNGTGDAPDEAWPFALAMFARGPQLVEATLLSAINVGGAAHVVGALVGSLLGALHGAQPRPPSAWFAHPRRAEVVGRLGAGA